MKSETANKSIRRKPKRYFDPYFKKIVEHRLPQVKLSKQSKQLLHNIGVHLVTRLGKLAQEICTHQGLSTINDSHFSKCVTLMHSPNLAKLLEKNGKEYVAKKSSDVAKKTSDVVNKTSD